MAHFLVWVSRRSGFYSACCSSLFSTCSAYFLLYSFLLGRATYILLSLNEPLIRGVDVQVVRFLGEMSRNPSSWSTLRKLLFLRRRIFTVVEYVTKLPRCKCIQGKKMRGLSLAFPPITHLQPKGDVTHERHCSIRHFRCNFSERKPFAPSAQHVVFNTRLNHPVLSCRMTHHAIRPYFVVHE